MLHTKFHQNQPSGSLERRFLKCFYQIWIWQPSWSCDQHYVDLFLQSYIQNLAENGPVVTDKMCKLPWAKVKKLP